MNIKTFYRKHIQPKPDYYAYDTMVNRVRGKDLGPAVVGAAAGAVVGGAFGYQKGLDALAEDVVSVETVSDSIKSPVLTGADYDPAHWRDVLRYDENGDSYYEKEWVPASWSPIISKRNTGAYEVKNKFSHSHWLGPVSGTILGMGVGAAVGALTSVVFRIAAEPHRDIFYEPKVPQTESDKKMARAGDHAPLVGGLIGAGVGGYFGAMAGRAADAKNQVLEQTVMEPIFEYRTIGHIPRERQTGSIPDSFFDRRDRVYYNQSVKDRFGEDPFRNGGRPIRRSVFTGEFRPVGRTTNSHLLGPVGGALIGAGLGAVTGVATGVAAGIFMKQYAGEDYPKGIF